MLLSKMIKHFLENLLVSLLYYLALFNAQSKARNKTECLCSHRKLPFQGGRNTKQETKEDNSLLEIVVLLSQRVNFMYKKSQEHCPLMIQGTLESKKKNVKIIEIILILNIYLLTEKLILLYVWIYKKLLLKNYF